MPDDDNQSLNDWKPRPDPTKLTSDLVSVATDQIRREAAAMMDLINARLTGIENAATKFEDNLNRVPTAVQDAVAHLKELHNEKFVSVAQQFTDSGIAVSAALDAAEKAVAKQELATGTLLTQLGVTQTVTANSLDSKITALELRITRIESEAIGSVSTAASTAQAVAARTSSNGLYITIVIAAASVAAVIVSFHH